MQARLLGAYRDAGGPAATAGEELAHRTAGALLLRAVEPFRSRDPDWDAHVDALVERAHRLVSGPATATLDRLAAG
jgi:hypothetical protein